MRPYPISGEFGGAPSPRPSPTPARLRGGRMRLLPSLLSKMGEGRGESARNPRALILPEPSPR